MPLSVARPAVLVAAVSVVATLDAQDPRQMGGTGLRVFEHAEFAGRSATLTRDTPDFRSIGLNDTVSSLRVAGREVWEVCEGRNYSGRCEVVSGIESDLRRHGWNDTISSARRVRGGGGGSRPPYGGRVGLILYSDRRFEGQELFLDRAVRDLRRYNFNDRAESLRVLGRQSWEVCMNIEYNDCRVVSGDISDLRSIGLREMISAVRPLGQPR
jgi:Beta/Gamma crystallin